MFNIRRDRGVPQAFDAIDPLDGSIYSIEPGGKPRIKKPVIQKNANTCKIIVANKKQAREVLNGLKRQCPALDVESVLSLATVEMRYLDNALNFKIHFGGSETFRSLCKTAVNFYLYKGGLQKNICHLISYIKDGDESDSTVRYLYSDKIQIPTEQDEVLHSIIIKGDSKEKILFAYIELFDFYKVVVMLNDNYEDEPVDYSYFFDVIAHTEVSREYTLSFTKEDFQNVARRDISPAYINSKILPHLRMVVQKALEKQDDEHRHALLTRALDKAIEKIDNRDLSQEEICNICTQEIMNQITPWIIHQLKNAGSPL